MLKILIALAVAGGVVFGAMKLHVLPNPTALVSKIHLPAFSSGTASKSFAELSGSSSAEASSSATPAPGKVAGISTEQLHKVGESVSEKGAGVANAISTLLTTQGNGSSDAQITIDVQKISDQIGVQMEKLPAQLVEKAKVAYCQQVLQNATNSATSH
jgi:hypothetical protein